MMVMSHAEWMKLTDGGRLSMRSGPLKKVDSALAAYHRTPNDAKLGELRSAFMNWIEDRGSDWRSSVRNRHNAVDTLRRHIFEPSEQPKLPVALQEEPRQQMLLLLRGAKVTWKNEFRNKLNFELVKPNSANFAPKLLVRQFATSGATNKIGLAANARGVVSASQTLHGGGGGESAAQGIVNKLIAEIVPAEFRLEVTGALETLLPSFMGEFVAAVTPYAGLLSAAGGTLWNTTSAVRKHYGVVKSRTHRDRSLAGLEVTAAINAVIRILERERNADIYSASVSALELGGKVGGVLADGGTATNVAIGLAANVAKLLNIVRIVYRDVREKNQANRMMAKGEISIEIFETCPLVGAYLVCCLPTSALMSLIFNRFGQAGWMDLAERTHRRHLEPLRDNARAVIKAHRFEIRSLARLPGVVEINEAEIKRMRKKAEETSQQRQRWDQEQALLFENFAIMGQDTRSRSGAVVSR